MALGKEKNLISYCFISHSSSIYVTENVTDQEWYER